MKKTMFALAISLVSLASATGFGQAASAQTLSGYVLKQKMIYYGNITINATMKGSRIDAKELQAYILPNSMALIYNNSNMKYCRLPQQIWIDKLTVAGHLGPVKKVNSGVYQGYKINQYVADLFKQNGNWWYQIEFTTTGDMHLPAQVTDDYLTLLGLPKGYGMPITINRHFDHEYTKPTHRKEVFLITYGAKPGQIDPKILVPPQSGYTAVKDEMDVILSDSEDPFK